MIRRSAVRNLKRTGRTRPKPLLKQNLRRQLAALDDYFNLDDDERAQRRPPIDHEVFRHPEVVKHILGNQQQKCAYCELRIGENVRRRQFEKSAVPPKKSRMSWASVTTSN